MAKLMTANQFRKLAISLPEAVESAHMNHPDFRVANKIFATLGAAGEGSAMVKLTPEQQHALLAEHPLMFTPAAGAWGVRGATLVNLKAAKSDVIRGTLLLAWRNTAPRKLIEEIDAG
jgi:hypothetical protein